MLSACITLDGKLAAGKSATGTIVAEALDYWFVEPRRLYEGVIWSLLKQRALFYGEMLSDRHLEKAIDQFTFSVERKPDASQYYLARRDTRMNRQGRYMHFVMRFNPPPYQFMIDEQPTPSDSESVEYLNASHAKLSDVYAWKGELTDQLIKNPAIRSLLQEKMISIAEVQNIVMAGDSISSSLLLAAGRRYVLEASQWCRNVREVDGMRQGLGAIIGRNEHLTTTEREDQRREQAPQRFSFLEDAQIINTEDVLIYDVANEMLPSEKYVPYPYEDDDRNYYSLQRDRVFGFRRNHMGYIEYYEIE